MVDMAEIVFEIHNFNISSMPMNYGWLNFVLLLKYPFYPILDPCLNILVYIS